MAPVSRRVVMCRVARRMRDCRQRNAASHLVRVLVRGHPGQSQRGPERPGRRGYSAQSPRGLTAEPGFVQRTTKPG